MSDFTLGPFGEVIPPPLVDGVTAEEAWQQAGLGPRPPGMGDAEFGGLAAMALQQKRLAEALVGRASAPDARALYEAVTRRGQPLSLRPLGMEQESYRTFAPVLQRVARDRWRVGVQSHGKTQEIFAADPAQALDRARELYVQWAEEENGIRGKV
jgi:hypothetical protein